MEKEEKEIIKEEKKEENDKKETDEYLMDTVDYTELFKKEFGSKDGK